MIAGCRVIRGSAWDHGDEDGGEGHLGTIIGSARGACANPDSQVQVVWDNGKMTDCLIGDPSKPEILLYDNGPTGVRHAGVKCSTCNEADIVGIRYQCLNCDYTTISLCSACYMAGKHKLYHCFKCFPSPGQSDGIEMDSRKDVQPIRIHGIHVGSLVERGRDWPDADKNEGRHGIVTEIQDFKNTYRSVVIVRWSDTEHAEGTTGLYRVGHHGFVEIELTEGGESEVGHCYSNHLPPVVTQPRKEYHKGEIVRVMKDKDQFEHLQRVFGVWEDGMQQICGRNGCVCGILEKDGYFYPEIFVDDNMWPVNPESLELVPRKGGQNSNAQLTQRSKNPGVQQLTDIQLRQLSKKIRADQFGELGTSLGFTNAELSVINADNHTTPERIYQMLLKWRNRQHENPNMDILLNILRQVQVLIHNETDVRPAGIRSHHEPVAGTIATPALRYADYRPPAITQSQHGDKWSLGDTLLLPYGNPRYITPTRTHPEVEVVITVPDKIDHNSAKLSITKSYVDKDRMILPTVTPDIQTNHLKNPDDLSPNEAGKEVLEEETQALVKRAVGDEHVTGADAIPSSDSNETGEKRELRNGDWVKVLTEEDFKCLQEDGHGGFVANMLEMRNSTGKVKRIDSDGDFRVQLDGKRTGFNKECLELVQSAAGHEESSWSSDCESSDDDDDVIQPRKEYHKGELVRVMKDKDQFEHLQRVLGVWEDGMQQICGRQGCISEICDKYGYVYPAIFIDDVLLPVNRDSLELVVQGDGQIFCTNNNVPLSRSIPRRQNPEVQQLTDIQLRKLSKNIRTHQFGELGTSLGFTNAELSVIYADNPTTPERIYQMLVKWRNRQHKRVNPENLLFDILQRSDLVLIRYDYETDVSRPTGLYSHYGTAAGIESPALRSPSYQLPSITQYGNKCSCGGPVPLPYGHPRGITPARPHSEVVITKPDEIDHNLAKQLAAQSDVDKESIIIQSSVTPVIHTELHGVEKPEDDLSTNEVGNEVLEEETHVSVKRTAEDEHVAGEDDIPSSNDAIPSSSEPGEKRELRKGDWVKVKDLTEEEFKRLQDGHGGFVPGMLEMKNTFGKVNKIDIVGSAVVRSDLIPGYLFNPDCLDLVDKKDVRNPVGRTSGGFKKGDRVKLRNLSVDEMKALQRGSGGYNDLMSIMRNSTGKVKRIDSDGDVRVKLDGGGPFWAFNPACLVHCDVVEDDLDGAMFKRKEGVRISKDISIEEMKKAQEDFGGWCPEMEQMRGKQAIVTKVTLSQICVKMHSGEVFAINPLLIVRDDEAATPRPQQRHFRKRDTVRVKDIPLEEMKKLQEGHGGWNPSLPELINKTGVIVSKHMGRTFVLKMDNGKRAGFNKECLELVQPAAGHEESSWSSDEESDSSSDDSDDDDEIVNRVAKELLSPLFQRVLRERTTDTDKTDKDVSVEGPQSLLDAISKGRRDRTHEIIALKPEWVDYLSGDGRATPLLMAVRMGYPGIVRLLIDAGASIELGNAAQGITPLILAAYEDKVHVLKYLISKGAKLNATDNDGDTALHAAIGRKNCECAKILLEHNCDINIRNKKDISAADMVANGPSDGETCALVLNAPGFDPSQRNKNGFNFVHVAARSGNARCLEDALTKWPQGLNVKKDDDWAPIHLVAANHNCEAAKVLLRYKDCDLEARTESGDTALIRAVLSGDLDMVNLLIDGGADIDAQDEDGDTSLHLACMGISNVTGILSSSSMAQLFSSIPGMSYKEGKDYDDSGKYLLTATCLAQRGARVDIKNHKGRYALQFLKDTQLITTLTDIAATKASEKAASASNDGANGGATHQGIQCDGCNKLPITGHRFKCVVCKDYDLCVKCESRGVHKEHDFIMYREPRKEKAAYLSSTCTSNAVGTCEAPANPYFPKDDFVAFDTPQVKPSTIMCKLRKFNAELDESCRRTEDDIAFLEELLYAVTNNKSHTNVTVQQSDVLRDILLQWPIDKLLPASDILRLAMCHPEVNRHLCKLVVGERFGARMIQRAVESNNRPIQMMVCRAFCNTFLHPAGRNFISTEKTRNQVIATVLEFEDIKIGALPTDNVGRNLRIAVATLLLNISVVLHTEGSTERWRCVNAVADIMEKSNDPATNFRLLVALGTLMTGDDSAVAIARSRGLLARLTVFLGPAGDSEKVGACAFYIAEMLYK